MKKHKKDKKERKATQQLLLLAQLAKKEREILTATVKEKDRESDQKKGQRKYQLSAAGEKYRDTASAVPRPNEGTEEGRRVDIITQEKSPTKWNQYSRKKYAEKTTRKRAFKFLIQVRKTSGNDHKFQF